MRLGQFLALHNDKDNVVHPMSVIDFDMGHYPQLRNHFQLPEVIIRVSLGHQCASALPPVLDPLQGISLFGLFSEHGSQTNWHVDFTGTAVFYLLMLGIKHLFLLLATLRNMELYEAWLRSGRTTYVYSYYVVKYIVDKERRRMYFDLSNIPVCV
jgi:hypothetical protein